MPQPLKFRAYQPLSKQMETVRGIDLNNDVSLVYTTENGYGGDLADIQQFTGLQDRQGRDIYEGDILELNRNPQHLAVVTWNVETAAFCIAYDFDGKHGMSDHLSGANMFEVIGNIHETPELLATPTE